MIGALAGGIAAGLSLPLLLAIADAQGWWHCPFLNRPRTQLLAFATFSVSYAAIALVGWRIERRFGRRGIAFSFAAVCIIAPVATVALTLGVMRLISGPAARDRLVSS